MLLGWCSRSDILGGDAARVVTGGVFRNFALVRGRGVAVWRLAGPNGPVEIEPFAPVADADAAALADEGRAVQRFLTTAGATNEDL